MIIFPQPPTRKTLAFLSDWVKDIKSKGKEEPGEEKEDSLCDAKYQKHSGKSKWFRKENQYIQGKTA